MSVSVVISQITTCQQPGGGGAPLHVKGTVASVPYSTGLYNQKFDTASLIAAGTPNAIASSYLSKYNAMVAGIALLASQTWAFSVLDGKSASVVFSSTPVVFTATSYDNLEITGTVGGTAAVIHVTQDVFLEQAGYAQTNWLVQWCANLIYTQRQQDILNATLTTTFSI
jgi:hypothetical protein